MVPEAQEMTFVKALTGQNKAPVVPEMSHGRALAGQKKDRTCPNLSVAIVDTALEEMTVDQEAEHQEKPSVAGQLRQRDQS